ncbi:uncharacterized protein LOC132310008 [Cornus florida]|uniref:uncharacterized protein LOC132310008 n=1 Tax=Cornus florida TaxID=4283 RepID=UPI0028A0B381|nr:uncharacterized protein LOC132310008 [Cornus florida]
MKRQAFRAACIRLKTYLAEKRLAKEKLLYEEVSASMADIVQEGFEKLDAIQIEDIESAPSRIEDNKAEVQDPLLEINVGTEKDHRPLFVSVLLEPNFQADLIKLLKEYKDCFAWSYEEIPGLSRELVEHRLPIKKDFQPYKQPPMRMSLEVMLKIKEEIERLLKAGFIRTVRYVEWLSNVVPVIKKNGKLRICVDFRNLNIATPKDEYLMPMADQLIDSAVKHEILSFMDGHSGYNQIYIAEEDIHKTAFRCPRAINTFEWVVMPFGLKNAGATYQRAINSIFHDMIGRFMEVYIDDVVVKSSAKKQYLEHLKKAFERMRVHKLKMNPLKCAFGVSAGNFLGFLVHKRGIEVDQNKAKAIMNAMAPTNKKLVQRFLGQAEYEALIIGLENLIEMAVGDVKILGDLNLDQLIKITRRSLHSAELRNTMLANSWVIDIEDLADDDWRIPFIIFLRNPNIKADRSIKRRAINFLLLDGDLYRKGLEDRLLLQCISKEESLQVMVEVHKGSCGAHQAGTKMRWLIRRGWGLDLIGKVNPPSSEDSHWVIVATDYFTKWVEAKVCKSVDQQTVINFIEQHIVHRFGIPETFVSDNATVFRAVDVLQCGHNMSIHMSASTPYYAQANGQAESSNKILIEIIEKMIKDKPRRWHETLSEALWAYKNSKKTGTVVTPYMLTYGHHDVLPMEMNVKSAKVAFQNNLTPADYTQAMLTELEYLDEVRLDALDHIIAHKRKVILHEDLHAREQGLELQTAMRQPR